ncbi:T9SS type A sorting domain-containing protein, partial [Aquimarina sp. M1]
QNWTTVSHTVNVNAGTYPFGIYAVSGGWNMNWIKITGQGNRSFDVTTETIETNTTQMYPNPFTNSIHFKFDEKSAAITVFDALGRSVVAPRIIESDTSIDLSNLNEGIYMVTIEKGGIKETKRLIKE